MWVHEQRRVFCDRLINAADRTTFNEYLRTAMEADTGLKWADVVGDRATIVFGDYMVPGADPKLYVEVADPATVQPVVEEYLNDYNAESKQPMRLVLFMDALEHVSRIARIVRQPGGNALLLGVGGSGRQSLSRLATYMAGYALFTLEISKGYGKNEWREDLKKILMKAGIEEKPTILCVRVLCECTVRAAFKSLTSFQFHPRPPAAFSPTRRSSSRAWLRTSTTS